MIIINKPLSSLSANVLSAILINHLGNFLLKYLLWAYILQHFILILFVRLVLIMQLIIFWYFDVARD